MGQTLEPAFFRPKMLSYWVPLQIWRPSELQLPLLSGRCATRHQQTPPSSWLPLRLQPPLQQLESSEMLQGSAAPPLLLPPQLTTAWA